MRKVLLLIVHIAEADASLGLEQALVVTRRRERMVEHLLMLHRLLLLLLGLDVMLPAEEIRTDVASVWKRNASRTTAIEALVDRIARPRDERRRHIIAELNLAM